MPATPFDFFYNPDANHIDPRDLVSSIFGGRRAPSASSEQQVADNTAQGNADIELAGKAAQEQNASQSQMADFLASIQRDMAAQDAINQQRLLSDQSAYQAQLAKQQQDWMSQESGANRTWNAEEAKADREWRDARSQRALQLLSGFLPANKRGMMQGFSAPAQATAPTLPPAAPGAAAKAPAPTGAMPPPRPGVPGMPNVPGGRTMRDFRPPPGASGWGAQPGGY